MFLLLLLLNYFQNSSQRPFVCQTCNKSYLRDTHLHAHARSHLPESMRPFVCERLSCAKRFWTSQHLRAHCSWHDGAKPYKVRCLVCFINVNSLVSHSALKPTASRHLRSTTSYVLIQVPHMHRQVQSLSNAGIVVAQNLLIQISIYEPTRRLMMVRQRTSAFRSRIFSARCRKTLYLHSY